MNDPNRHSPEVDALSACQRRCLAALFGPSQNPDTRSDREIAAPQLPSHSASRFHPNLSNKAHEETQAIFDDRYRIDRRIAEGGTASVFEAEHLGTGRSVALKILSRNWMNAGNLRQRFIAEARITSEIVHPNVVEVLDAGVSKDGLYYVATEYIDGEPLSDLLDRNGSLPWTDVRSICLQLTSGLERAHLKGVIHRDLKPGNIIIVLDGSSPPSARLIDFGLAQFHGHSERTWESHRGQPVGSAPTMSPEQVRGEKVTASSDIYALGCLLHRMLAGAYPLQGATFAEFAAAHLHTQPSSLPDCGLPDPVHLQVDQLIHACLRKEPSRRPQSMADLRERLLSIPESSDLEDLGRPVPRRLKTAVSNNLAPRVRTLKSLGAQGIVMCLAAVLMLGFLVADYVPTGGGRSDSTASVQLPQRSSIQRKREIIPPITMDRADFVQKRSVSVSLVKLDAQSKPSDSHPLKHRKTRQPGATSSPTRHRVDNRGLNLIERTSGIVPAVANRRSEVEAPRTAPRVVDHPVRASKPHRRGSGEGELLKLNFAQNRSKGSMAHAEAKLDQHRRTFPALLDPFGAP